jgi:osmotically-inducible protein OsmY
MTNVRLSRRGPRVATIVFAALVSWSPFSAFDVAQAAQPCTKAAAHDAQLADRRTTEEVVRRIASDETVAGLAPRVHVTTSDGVVTLRGAIASDEDRVVLGSLAESAPGVRSVDDRLEVQAWPEQPSASRAR